MDGWTAAWTRAKGRRKGGKKWSVYIIQTGINASSVTVVTSTSISKCGLHLLLLLGPYQCTASVCVSISVFKNVSLLAWATR